MEIPKSARWGLAKNAVIVPKNAIKKSTLNHVTALICPNVRLSRLLLITEAVVCCTALTIALFPVVLPPSVTRHRELQSSYGPLVSCFYTAIPGMIGAALEVPAVSFRLVSINSHPTKCDAL